MKQIIFFTLIFFAYNQSLFSQTNDKIWEHKIFDYSIKLNFENEIIKIDSIDSYEGYIYYFSLLNDSSYFRVNYLTPNAKFECCNENSIYKEIKSCKENNIIDRSGKVNSKNFYWREIKNKEIEIVYNNCSEDKLKLFNKIMNSVYNQLISIKSKE